MANAKRRFLNDVDGKFKLAFKYQDEQGKTKTDYLLWGDPVTVINEDKNAGTVQFEARGRSGTIEARFLTDASLLELYIIDVGQGDGILIRTPDDAWHMVDAGRSNQRQKLRKGAANFVRWKFIKDLQQDGVTLENAILTHPDDDHYGGFIDLMGGQLEGHPRFTTTIKNFYHSGMARFADAPDLGATTKGTVPTFPFDDYGMKENDDFIVELLGGKNSFANPGRPFEEHFAPFAAQVGKVPTKVSQLTCDAEHLPGYAPGNPSGVSIRVLGPVLEQINGGPAKGLRVFADESHTRNGHSIVLRLDFNKVRILLTGDLNTEAQRLLLSYQGLLEFATDVAKGCHHGSDDIDARFVKAMKPRVTVISSGDAEDYAHPRPRVMGAMARYGRESKSDTKSEKGVTLPPLLYSTELARSVNLAIPGAVRQTGTNTPIAADQVEIRSNIPRSSFVPLSHAYLGSDLVYGLINVRTDGERVLCAYKKEQTEDFDLRVFRAGVEP